MSRNLKFFLIVFVLSLPFWWGVNVLGEKLENFFYWREISQNTQIFTAQIILEEKLNKLKPIRHRNVEDLEIRATSVISVFLDNKGKEKILFEKESGKILPIASLTKLMTALVVLENYDFSKEIKISEKAVEQPEDLGKLVAERIFPVKYLLYPLLMESSNDAAFSLANDYDGMTGEKFVTLMNSAAQKLNLNDTFFVNPSGLDPETKTPETKINYSTASDLAKLTKELLKKPLIWEILSTPRYNFYGPELLNTNELLGEIPEIVGGKTGYTYTAGGCMVLVTIAPKDAGFLVNVILGTDGKNGRFGEMKKLANWLNTAYKW